MSIRCRVHANKNFTVLNNGPIKDKTLSLRAKGLLSCMFSFPPDWDYSERGLTTLSTDGRNSVHSALEELEQHGYLKRTRDRLPNGTLGKSIYELYDSIDHDSPVVSKGDFRFHTAGNYTVVNNHLFHDKTLSWKAKGLLTSMLSLPPEWDFTEKGLVALSSDGMTSLRSGMKELVQTGYIRRHFERISGKIADIIYDIYETPSQGDNDILPPSNFKPGFIQASKNNDCQTSNSAYYSGENYDSSNDDASNISIGTTNEPLFENPALDNPKMGVPNTDEPFLGSPAQVSPISVKPSLENLPQLNTNRIKYLINKELNHQSGSGPLTMFANTLQQLRLRHPNLDDDLLTINNVLSKILLTRPSIVVNQTVVPGDKTYEAFIKLQMEDIEAVLLAAAGRQISNKDTYYTTALYNRIIQKETVHYGNAYNSYSGNTFGNGVKRYNSGRSTFNSFEQRTYDYDDLERQLLGTQMRLAKEAPQ